VVKKISSVILSVFSIIPPWAVLLFSGIIGGLALTVPVLWPLIFVFLIPLFERVYRKDTTAMWTFFYGWIFGYGLIGVAVFWIFNAYPLDWVGITDPTIGHLMTTVIWFVTSAATALFIGLWAVAAHLIVRRHPIDLITMPISWVIFEWVRIWGCTLVTWGSGSVLAPYFSFGMIGYALGNSAALLQIARFGGVYALSFVVSFVSMVLWAIVAKKKEIVPRRQALTFAAALCVAYILLVIFPYTPPHARLRVETIETDFPATATVSDAMQSVEDDSIKAKLAGIAASGGMPDVIVLPEDIRFLQTMETHGEDPQVYLRSIFGSREVLLIDSARTDTFTGTFSRVTFFSSLHGVIATRDKYLLIPVGEYIPAVMKWGMDMVGMSNELTIDEANRDYLPGVPPTGVVYHGATLIVLLCSEMVPPNLYYDAARRTMDPIFINMSSQSDFHHGNEPFFELRDMAIVQSAWSNAPFFQSTNGAPMVRIGG
jgi:apolipoprotein N-acyltransferase